MLPPCAFPAMESLTETVEPIGNRAPVSTMVGARVGAEDEADVASVIVEQPARLSAPELPVRIFVPTPTAEFNAAATEGFLASKSRRYP